MFWLWRSSADCSQGDSGGTVVTAADERVLESMQRESEYEARKEQRRMVHEVFDKVPVKCATFICSSYCERR